MFGGGPILWRSKTQPITTLSLTESQYVALSLCAQEAIFLKNLIFSLKINDFGPVTIYEDNLGTIQLAKNKVTNSRSKHIDIRYHFIREKVEKNEILVKFCPTNDMVADMLTKPLSAPKIKYFIKILDLDRNLKLGGSVKMSNFDITSISNSVNTLATLKHG